MSTDRTQRQIDRLLDKAGAAFKSQEWSAVATATGRTLALDPENVDAVNLLRAAEGGLTGTSDSDALGSPDSLAARPPNFSSAPSSFANGRNQVERFLGEGRRKKVYLAHDTLQDRDAAFALIQTEGHIRPTKHVSMQLER